MSTMICETRDDAAMNLNELNTEVRLSDVEISRRVLAIRSGWSISERVRRRNDANERFLDLMVALSTCDAA
ncbi:hypothetical protein SH528x_001704 [Novipirellula sp. SH528]|uniref:hypothetical protein n=1 Tax=Novipirellula sp. SH528 TaxID=3454466 RepID=UPI003F9EE6F5